MKRDPLMALESHFASQPRNPSADFEQRMKGLLEDEMQPVDIVPIVSGFRKALPLAAAIVFGVLSPRVSQTDTEALANQIEQRQASSVLTELETPWEE